MSKQYLASPVLVLPPAWRELDPMAIQGVPVRVYASAFGPRVLVSREDRGAATGVWLHVSVSRTSRLPTWADLREAKDLFVGRDRCAIHMIPPEEHYVNVHPHTFHLFTRLDGPTVPPLLYEDG